MSNNLFISYDLNSPGQNYTSVIETIKSLGSWANPQKSFWYVKSSLTAAQAVDKVWQTMDKNDSLMVVNATDNSAAWRGLDPRVEQHLKERWLK